jgi:NADPH-dependent curcumin reductase CurA
MAKVVIDGFFGNSSGFKDFVIEGENLKECASKLIEKCPSGIILAFSNDGEDVSDKLVGMINLIDKGDNL